MEKKIRVIHLPTTTGGNPQGISKHLNRIGVNSETWTLNDNFYGYQVDKIIFKSGDSAIMQEIKKFFALRYVFKCDIVFFNFGSGLYQPFFGFPTNGFINKLKFLLHPNFVIRLIMSRIEIMLLRLRGIPIFIQYQGDDARQGDITKKLYKIHFADRVNEGYYNKYSDTAKRKRIEFYSKFVSKVYALNPDLLNVLPKTTEFLPYSHIDLNDWKPEFTQLEKRVLRIGHAPTNREVKGTDLIVDSLERLKKEGYEFEFVLIEGMSNKEAKEVYKTVDLVVDQLFAGWYGGLAVEVMALGKPVVAYIREEDLVNIPEMMRIDLPIIRSEPVEIYSTLKHVLELPRSELVEIAKKSRVYVEKWHNPIEIAKRIKKDMERELNRF